MKILIAPDKTLTTPSKKIKKIDNTTQNFIQNMKKTLIAQREPLGVGLSAPQVGILQHIFIVRFEKNKPIHHFINPEITDVKNSNKKSSSDEEESMLEGCLSIPYTWAQIERDDQIKLKYQKLDGTHHEKWFSGFASVVIQHEIDHLHGILFTQRAIEQGSPIYKEVKGKLVPIGG